jgi:starch synthase
MAMRVAMLAAECEPWAKTGGLADVVDALARALGRLPGTGAGVAAPVDVFLPRYRSVPVPDGALTEPVLRIDDPDVRRSSAKIAVSIVNVEADGYRLRLVDVPAAFDRDGFYDHPDDPWRFAVFCRAAIAALRRDGRPLDVLHVHDWHTGPALIERARADLARDPFLAPTAVVVTLHNLAYHGWTGLADIGQLGLHAGEPLAGANPHGIDLLLTAIERSEIANTVSPGFAREALTPAFGMGLDGDLRAKGNRFIGILNGIDPDVWDPANDPALAASYSRSDPAAKAACRRDLLARNGLDPDDDRVVLGMIGRMDPQKGFDLLADGMPDLLAAGARVIVQGSGHASLADPFRALAAAHPAQVSLIERFDRDMARRIYAGADLFLMPSRFEPCGQGQMIALRYGTPPVVRRTGGLADSVVDVDERPADGTGFVFDDATPAALVAAVTRAAALRASDPAAWAALRDRGMAVDFRWDTGSAPRYVEAYRRAVALRRGDA